MWAAAPPLASYQWLSEEIWGENLAPCHGRSFPVCIRVLFLRFSQGLLPLTPLNFCQYENATLRRQETVSRCRFEHAMKQNAWCSCRRLEQKLKLYERGEVPRIPWMDRLALKKIDERCRQVSIPPH